jgi:glutamate-1-semialdehyde aminotransferase
VPARAYGEPLPPMPSFRFTHELPEVNARLTQTFFRAVLARGVLLHPRHMWFVSLAHTARDIDHTLEVAEGALRLARRELP